MAYNIEYHDSYAWIDTTPDDYTNEGGFESSHYTTNNDTNEEGFESSSSYSSISCLSPIDAASANSFYSTSKYCCIVSEEYDTRFFNTFSCIRTPFTKDEFDDEYTMGDESTCSSLILNDYSILEDYYDDKNVSNRIGVLILNLNEDTSDQSTSSASTTTTSTGDSYTHLVASRTNVGKSYDDTDKDATTVAADTIIAATKVSSQVYDSHKAYQNEGDVMMRSKAPKSSKRSSFSDNVTLLRSSSFAVEAIAKAPQKVDAKSKSSAEKKMKSSTRTKNKTPPTRSADKSEGIWTEYIDATIGRSYYSNGIITSWTRPNCPEMRIKHIIKNGQTNPKSLTRTKNKTPPTRSADKSEGIWTEYIDSTIGRSYYSNGIITTWTRPNCPEKRMKHIIKNGHTNPIITQMVLSLHGQGLQ